MKRIVLPMLMLPGLAAAHIDPSDHWQTSPQASVVEIAISTPVSAPQDDGICYPGVTVEEGVLVLACASK